MNEGKVVAIPKDVKNLFGFNSTKVEEEIMKKDKLKVYMIEFLICILLFFTLFVSNMYLRWIIAAILLGFTFVVKKILNNYNKNRC